MRGPWSFASFLGAAAVVALLSCQAIVSGDIPGFTCTPGVPNTCPPGQYCFGAGCIPCVANDPCDGYDNNCNGKIDETSDNDQDGFTSCGQNVGGEIVDRDCDDSDNSINPKATETCNGRDDNCNGQIDEGVCGEGEVCAPKSGRCVPTSIDCTTNPSLCVPPLVCDPGTLLCVNQNQALGAACSGDASCRTGLCGDERMLTRRVIDSTKASVCTKGCCTSKDCDPNFVCFGAGTGGSYCVHHQHLQRVVPGAKLPGERCDTDGECRSSKCGADKTCVDTCCSGADCTNGTQCAAIRFDGHDTFACTPSLATQDANASCTSDQSCKSNLCYTYPYGFGYDRCVAPCCGAKSCSTVTLGAFGEFKLYCNNERLVSGDVLASCSFASQTPTGGKQIGDECSDFTECVTYRCNQFGSKKYCTDVCCTDADCPREKGFACRAAQVRLENTPYSVLRCVPVQ